MTSITEENRGTAKHQLSVVNQMRVPPGMDQQQPQPPHIFVLIKKFSLTLNSSLSDQRLVRELMEKFTKGGMPNLLKLAAS